MKMTKCKKIKKFFKKIKTIKPLCIKGFIVFLYGKIKILNIFFIKSIDKKY